MASLLSDLNAYDAGIFIQCYEFYVEINSNYSRDNHERERHMFQEDARIIRRVAVKQKLKNEKFFETTFAYFTNFVKSYFTNELKTKVLTVAKESPTAAIFWCTDLVLSNHLCNHENNCLTFMAPLIKLYFLSFRAIDYGTINPSLNCCQYEVYVKLNRYLELVKSLNYDLAFVSACFNVFAIERKVVECYFETASIENMHSTINAIQKLRYNIQGLFSSDNVVNMDISHRCILSDNLRHLKILLDHGACNNYSPEAVNFYISKIKAEDVCLYNFISDVGSSSLPRDSYTMRAYQTLYAYCLTPKVRSRLSQTRMIEQTMRMLWSTIRDPFLTRNDIVNCFGDSPREVYLLLRKVWFWYSRHISRDTRNVYESRTLKHLCRCTIREKLGSNLQLPRSISSINYPTVLKNYLLLEESLYPLRRRMM